LRAFSANGKQLWQADELRPVKGETYDHGLQIERLRDEAEPVLAVRHLVRFEDKHGSMQEQITLLAAESGKVLWRQTLGERTAGHNLPPLRFADLNQDQVKDVIISRREPSGGFDLIALDGRDGRQLWKKKVGSRWGENEARLVLADFGGHGHPDVVVGDRSEALIRALHGKDGSEKWTWVPEVANPPRLTGYHLSEPVLVSQGKTCFVAVSVLDPNRQHVQDEKTRQMVPTGKSGHYLVLLNADGKQHRRHEFANTSGISFPGPNPVVPFWVHDLDGDGQDEIVFIEGGELVATTSELRPLWKAPIPFQHGTVHHFIPATREAAATIVVGVGMHQLYGVDGKTGAVRWYSRGSDAFQGILPAKDAKEPPGILEHVGPFTVCRQAVPTTAKGEPLPPARSDVAVTTTTVIHYRPLPWDNEWNAPVTAFALLFVFIAGWWAKRRGWHALAILIAGYAVLTVALAGYRLWIDSPPLAADEAYDWSGWPRALYLPVEWAGLLLALFLFAAVLLRGGLWLVRRKRR
jgi:outer membrane protein assembly factor BamB